MANKKILIAVLALAISVNAGCGIINKPVTSGDTNIAEPADAKQERIMKEYENIINEENGILEYISFIDKNIGDLSPDNASMLIIKLEEMQKEHRLRLEDKYYIPDIQNELDETFRPEYDLSNVKVEDVKSEGAKKILQETNELGYKVETAEGSFFPIIDYGFYEKYSSYVNLDIKDYISIMTVESDKVPAKDAAMVISWDELFERAFNQEKFLEEHKASSKFEELEALYKKYVTFAIYGLDNTPLFNYDGNTMNADAKAAYAKSIAKDSNLSRIMKEYYETIEKNGFKLTDKVKSYRNDLANTMKLMP
ncbi:MAG: hypothetical protein PHC44_05155 [Lutispora sp.]|nr:hypothetical protein [Lutispora sp.]MDD4834105.1 hypothetical protein [Lutispora sp.]